MAQQFPVVMGDHEIDLVHAEEDDKKAGENAEIRGEISHLTKDQVLGYPDDTGCEKDGIGNFLSDPEESPDPELPENKDPFQQGIGIDDIGIADLVVNKINADRFGHQAGQRHKKKGLIGFAKTAETNQPRNTGYDRNDSTEIPVKYMHSLVESAAVIAAGSGTTRAVLKRLPVTDLQGFDMCALFRLVVEVHIMPDNIISERVIGH